MRLCFSQTPEDRFSPVEAHFSIACTVYLKKKGKKELLETMKTKMKYIVPQNPVFCQNLRSHMYM